ncbi:MAG: ATP-binding cassette domain-containing protein [Candidatus Velthaea sp.]
MKSFEPDAMIVVERLTKTFPERANVLKRLRLRGRVPRRTVLDDVSFRVGRGELLGLLGANGAGKTTLLQVLATLAHGDSGIVTIDGVSTRAEPGRIRNMIGYCGSAERAFYYRLTVRDNLRFFGTLAGLRGGHLDRRIDEVLELVDLGASRDQLYAQFSTGMRQRLAVARALLGDPPVLLFDEPTRAVDPMHAESVRKLIRTTLIEELRKTVVLATNLLEEAWAVCDRIAILRAGRIIAIDSPQKLETAQLRNRHYRVVVDRITDDLLTSTRSLPSLIDVRAEQHADHATMDVLFAPSDVSMTALLRALSADGTDVRAISLQTMKPAAVFKALMGENA